MRRLTATIILLIAFSLSAHAQMRNEIVSPYEYGGRILNPNPAEGANFSNLFNLQVSHSYSANFASFGGQYQSMNAFTSSFQMFFSEKLDGRVDVSFLHSPFGGNNMMNGMNNGLGGQVMISNAEFNYRPSERMLIQVRFSQAPNAFGFNRFSPFNGFNRNRFGYW